MQRNLSDDLQRAFPGLRRFSERNLRNMQRLAEAYPEPDKVVQETDDGQGSEPLKQDKGRFLGGLDSKSPSGDAKQPETRDETYFYLALSKELFFKVGFTHHILLLNRCKDLTERRFYMEETVRNQWAIDTLEFALDRKFYQTRGRCQIRSSGLYQHR